MSPLNKKASLALEKWCFQLVSQYPSISFSYKKAILNVSSKLFLVSSGEQVQMNYLTLAQGWLLQGTGKELWHEKQLNWRKKTYNIFLWIKDFFLITLRKSSLCLWCECWRINQHCKPKRKKCNSCYTFNLQRAVQQQQQQPCALGGSPRWFTL